MATSYQAAAPEGERIASQSKMFWRSALARARMLMRYFIAAEEGCGPLETPRRIPQGVDQHRLLPNPPTPRGGPPQCLQNPPVGDAESATYRRPLPERAC